MKRLKLILVVAIFAAGAVILPLVQAESLSANLTGIGTHDKTGAFWHAVSDGVYIYAFNGETLYRNVPGSTAMTPLAASPAAYSSSFSHGSDYGDNRGDMVMINGNIHLFPSSASYEGIDGSWRFDMLTNEWVDGGYPTYFSYSISEIEVVGSTVWAFGDYWGCDEAALLSEDNVVLTYDLFPDHCLTHMEVTTDGTNAYIVGGWHENGWSSLANVYVWPLGSLDPAVAGPALPDSDFIGLSSYFDPVSGNVYVMGGSATWWFHGHTSVQDVIYQYNTYSKKLSQVPGVKFSNYSTSDTCHADGIDAPGIAVVGTSAYVFDAKGRYDYSHCQSAIFRFTPRS